MSDIPVDPGVADATAGRRQQRHLPFTGASAANPTTVASSAPSGGLGFSNGDEGILAALAAVSRTDPRTGVSPGADNDASTPFGTAADINAIFAQSGAGDEADVDPALPDQLDGGDDQDGEGLDGDKGKTKVWACNVCGRVFTRRFNCTTHEKTHLDQRDYPCTLCPRAFTRRHDLERHINSVHPGHYVDKSGLDDEDDGSPTGVEDGSELPSLIPSATPSKRGKRRASRDAGPREVKIRRVEDNELVTAAPVGVSAAPIISPLTAVTTTEHPPTSGNDLGDLQIDASLLNTGSASPAPASFDPPAPAVPSYAHPGEGDAGPIYHPTKNSTNGGRGTRDGPVERVENLEAANPDGDKVFKVQNTKKWACGSCGRMFVRRNNCKAHEMTHRDVREYPCVVCGRAFSRRHDLERHQSAVHPGYNIPDRGNKRGRGGRRKQRQHDGDDDDEDDEADQVEDEGDALDDAEGAGRKTRNKQKSFKSNRPRQGRSAGGGSELEDVGELDDDDEDGPAFGRPNRAGRRGNRLSTMNHHDDAPPSPTTAAVAALAEGVAAASRNHHDDGEAGGRSFSIEDYPESNLRGGRESDVRNDGPSGTGSKDGDLPASVLDQLASVGNGQISYDQAQALRALLASRAGLTSSSASGPGGDGEGGSNIDPSLEALGGSTGNMGDFPSSGGNNDATTNGTVGGTSGVGKDHSQHGSHHPHASGLTSSAAAALAALTSMDFSTLPGLR